MANVARSEQTPYVHYGLRVMQLERLKKKWMLRLSTSITVLLLVRLLYLCVVSR